MPRGRGYTKVDLRHLLEDLRDAYPGSLEETILTELVANALDARATHISREFAPLRADRAARLRRRARHGGRVHSAGRPELLLSECDRWAFPRSMSVHAFQRYIGVDYSGAKTPTSSLSGLRAYVADQQSLPVEMHPPPSPRKYWTRKGLAEWLVERLRQETSSLVGIDHGFSFPLRYFEAHRLEPDWLAFLDDFQSHWPTDGDDMYVDFIRDDSRGRGSDRMGNARWRRLTEVRARSAKSVFHFDVPGSVAKSTHAGLPWLRHLRREVGEHVHFWPFDGWDIPPGRSAVVEVYPSLWSRGYDSDGRTGDQQDAYAAAAWMRAMDADGSLVGFLNPRLTPSERATAQVEGWILGVK